MQLRRFEGGSMAEAVRKVKEELGPDALVLSSRTFRRDRGMFGLFGKSVVELTAAADRERRRERAGAGADEAQARASGQARVAGSGGLETLEAEVARLRAEITRFTRTSLERGDLHRELDEIREKLADLGSPHRTPPAAASESDAEWLALGIAHRHAAGLGEEARELEAREGLARAPALRRARERRLDARLESPRSDDPARARLFVGAPGVGKTTTLAKLAAREGDRESGVSLVTTDTFRIGAEEQLRTYAGLLQLPFTTALSARAVSEQIRRPGARRVYIDSAGRSRSDEGAVEELLEFREALGTPSRVDLVVSATTKEEDLRAQVRRYAPLRPDSLIVTKVDESDSLGSVVNLLLDEQCPPLLWLGTGQRVPEDLAVPEPAALCDALSRCAA